MQFILSLRALTLLQLLLLSYSIPLQRLHHSSDLARLLVVRAPYSVVAVDGSSESSLAIVSAQATVSPTAGPTITKEETTSITATTTAFQSSKAVLFSVQTSEAKVSTVTISDIITVGGPQPTALSSKTAKVSPSLSEKSTAAIVTQPRAISLSSEPIATMSVAYGAPIIPTTRTHGEGIVYSAPGRINSTLTRSSGPTGTSTMTQEATISCRIPKPQIFNGL